MRAGHGSRHRPARAFALALGLLALIAAGPVAEVAVAIVPNPDPTTIERWEPCEPDTGVTVIVDQEQIVGNGKISVGCALGEQENGLAALHNAGFTTAGTTKEGDAFVCRINGQPTTEEQTCDVTPGACCYWSYWHGRPGGRWAYSGVGATSPLSRAPVNTVEGWGFGGRPPRIEPLDGRGPSAFSLPPPQESSAIPKALAREWLAPTVAGTLAMAEEPGTGVRISVEEQLIDVVALARAGAATAEVRTLVESLSGGPTSHGGAFEYSTLQAYANSVGVGTEKDPAEAEFPWHGDAEKYAGAITAVTALGGDPTDFGGVDLRAELLTKVYDLNGKIQNRFTSAPVSRSAEINETAPTVEALALSGGLPEKAQKTLGLVLAAQNPTTGAFGESIRLQLMAIRALVAAREDGMSGLGPAIAEAGAFVEETLQEPDGSVREAVRPRVAEEHYGPTPESTSEGAVALKLAGRTAAAERAARWVSQFQVTAECAGGPDPVTGEPSVAEPLIGAFFLSEPELRNAINNGIPAPYEEAQVPTAKALEALSVAGPYGPPNASLDRGSLGFESEAIGLRTGPQSVTLTNHEEGPLTIESIGGSGDVADFDLDASACQAHALAPGEACELSASFAPTATGFREAIVILTVTGGGRLLLALSGTGLPGAEGNETVGGNGSQGSLPAAPSPPKGGPAPGAAMVGADAVRAFGTARIARRGGIARLARLSCPGGASCAIKAPSRVRVRLADGTAWLPVVSPQALNAGASGILGVRLSRALVARLAGRPVAVSVPVTISNPAGERTVRVRVELLARDGR